MWMAKSKHTHALFFLYTAHPCTCSSSSGTKSSPAYGPWVILITKRIVWAYPWFLNSSHWQKKRLLGHQADEINPKINVRVRPTNRITKVQIVQKKSANWVYLWMPYGGVFTQCSWQKKSANCAIYIYFLTKRK